MERDLMCFQHLREGQAIWRAQIKREEVLIDGTGCVRCWNQAGLPWREAKHRGLQTQQWETLNKKRRRISGGSVCSRVEQKSRRDEREKSEIVRSWNITMNAEILPNVGLGGQDVGKASSPVQLTTKVSIWSSSRCSGQLFSTCSRPMWQRSLQEPLWHGNGPSWHGGDTKKPEGTSTQEPCSSVEFRAKLTWCRIQIYPFNHMGPCMIYWTLQALNHVTCCWLGLKCTPPPGAKGLLKG